MKKTDTVKSREIHVGEVAIGGGAPVVVQSMTKTQTEDIRATVAQITRLEKAGCEIIRIAVPHKKALRAIKEIKEKINIPLIADIHFKDDFAIGALENGADCVRINPGNLGGAKPFNNVLKAAVNLGRAVRIGVNAGSLDPQFEKKKNLSEPQKLVQSALQYVQRAEKAGLADFKVSMKSFDVNTTVDAYRSFTAQCDAPLHIGITEAGDIFNGSIRSAVGLGILLHEGIGDTMRVSLTAPPVKEVEAAWEILRALDLRRHGIEVVSCPTCGRCGADIETIVKEFRKKSEGLEIDARVAIMGCEVNGPGEAKSADLGLAMNSKGSGVLFANGEVVKKVTADKCVEELITELMKIVMIED